jgi:hypothetical protein
MVCSEDYIKRLITMKKNGEAVTLENIVSFEEIKGEDLTDAKEAGLRLLHYDEVLKAGKSSSISS